MGGYPYISKCYTFLASLDINQPPNFTKFYKVSYGN